MFFGPVGKTRRPSWFLIGWDIFDFCSETAKWNLRNLDGKQDINVLYHVCVFRNDQKKNGHPGLWCWDIFDISSETAEYIPTNLDRRQYLNVPYKVCGVFLWGGGRGLIRKLTCPPWPRIRWDIFWLLFCNRWTEFYKTWMKKIVQEAKVCRNRVREQKHQPRTFIFRRFGSKWCIQSLKIVFQFDDVCANGWP